MHDMAQPLMLTTQLYFVFQESNIKHCCYNFKMCWYSTHRIVGCVTLSKKAHAVAYTRELEATKIVLQVIEKRTTSTYNSKQFNYYSLGLNVFEVAHDNCSYVKRFIIDDFNIVNSFDTWHGVICFTLSTFFKNSSKSFRNADGGLCLYSIPT